jgi:hypothetical protein
VADHLYRSVLFRQVYPLNNHWCTLEY